MDVALELKHVNKAFGATRAIDGLCLTVPRGTTCGLIGPSGAGKTTAIRMIMSILFPDSGSLCVLGQASALQAKARIGYLPEERGVYPKMRVRAFLSYIGRLKSPDRKEIEARAAQLLERVGLAEAMNKKCEDLSKGMLQRVQFVAAIVHRPDLLILDEPFSGLDPLSVRTLKELIAEEQRRGATIIFSTHVMAHAEELCQHVIMIHKGRKVLDEPMSGLRRRYDVHTICLEPLEAMADLMALKSVPGIERIKLTDEGCEIGLAADSEPANMMRNIAAAVTPARIEFARIRLEDVFIRIVGAGVASSEESQIMLRTHLQGLGREGVSA